MSAGGRTELLDGAPPNGMTATVQQRVACATLRRFNVSQRFTLLIMVTTPCVLHATTSCADLPTVDQERDALTRFYTATNGSQWTRSDNWTGSPSVCDWFGVSCDTDGFVSELSLDSNNVRGPSGRSLCNLTRLEVLKLGSNSISGTMAECLGRCKQLRVIDFSLNLVDGTIPTSFAELPLLEVLALYGETGGDCSSTGKLAGNVPLLGIDQPHLSKVLLKSNLLSGNIPESLCEIGPMPPEFCRFDDDDGNCQDFSLHLNHFSGTLPACLANLTSMNFFSVFCNDLTGTLPPDWSSWNDLNMA